MLLTGVFSYFKVNISPVHNNTSYKYFIANEKEPRVHGKERSD